MEINKKTRPLYIKVSEKDNVAITVDVVAKGTTVVDDVIAHQEIPEGHKIALVDIKAKGEIIRYGVVLGYAINAIAKGDWINEHMLELPAVPDLDDMKFAINIKTDLPTPPVTTFKGYKNPNGGYAGTRNILAINTTVQCVTGVLNVAVAQLKSTILA